ncbi:MAG: glycosyltransferase family 4 protein [Lachnospiraceae bacterium]|nr:glycosyltransferase family 4 protein [Lachnospiraceae bacterium]
MRHAVAKYSDTDIFISTNFSFSPIAYTNKPCCLFCDWSYEYYIAHFLGRAPDYMEQLEIRRQNHLLQSADHVFVLFPDVAEWLQERFSSKHFHYLGNVINSKSVSGTPPVEPSEKLSHPSILFIGLPKYREGILSLIQAVIMLRRKEAYSQLQLHIIGMHQEDLQKDIKLCPDLKGISFHGYLSKDIPREQTLYYQLLDSATVYVNTTPKWAGFSSALEALYHYVPVITTPYESFLQTFGENLSCGFYCPSNTPELIAKNLEQILTMTQRTYEAVCRNAHQVSLDHTWDAYIQRMLQVINHAAKD